MYVVYSCLPSFLKLSSRPSCLPVPSLRKSPREKLELGDTPLVHHVKGEGVVCCCGLAGWEREGGREVRKEGNQRHNRHRKKSESSETSNAFAPALACPPVPLLLSAHDSLQPQPHIATGTRSGHGEAHREAQKKNGLRSRGRIEGGREREGRSDC